MKQQTIIIIGATSGIGKTLFEKYAADGNRIGIVGRRTHLLDELRQEHPDMTVTATADKGHGSSRAREFHPHPLTEPCVKVSPHTALHTQLFVHRHNLGV